MASLNETFDKRFRDAKNEAATAAEQGAVALNKSLRGVVDLQAAEIERLRSIIENATDLPERAPEVIAASSFVGDRRERTDVVVRATDKSLWLLPNAPRSPYELPHREGWIRLPALPQVEDEMDRPGRAQENDE